MTKLALEQAIVITGYTGFLACNFSDFHADLEKRIGRPVWTHEMGCSEFKEQIKQLYKDDFISMCRTEDESC